MRGRLVAALVVIGCSSSAFAEDSDNRPSGFTVGLGAGWSTPIKVLEPNAVSARVRVGPVTLEPSLEVRGLSGSDNNLSTTTPDGQPPVEAKTVDKNSGFTAAVSTDVRYPLIARGPVDFLVIGGLGFVQTSTNTDRNIEDPNGNIDNSKFSATGVSVRWGIGAEWFFHRNISFSADVRNPLFTLTKSTSTTERKQPVGPTSVTTNTRIEGTDIDYGLIFSPSVRAMFHFYF